MDFTGFDPDDFELFAIPDFEGRMAAIRAHLRPKLTALGADLTGEIERIVETPTHPHVAQHMRRRVNPPVETWVAFARDKRGYKRWTHYRVAVSQAGVRVTVFVEDDADDKSPFGANLAAHASSLMKTLGAIENLHWYGMEAERGVDAGALAAEGERLQRLKTLKFQAGVPLAAKAALKMKPAAFEAWALRQVAALKPLYLAGARGELSL